MTDSATYRVEDDEIDLLDLLVVIAENLKLLFFVPLFVGLVALGIAFVLPKTFASQSMLNTSKLGLDVSPQALASFIKSTDTLAAVADEMKFATESSHESRLRSLDSRIHVSVGKQDKLVTLKTHAETPEKAQALNAAIWKHVLPLTIPRNTDMERLKTQVKAEKERLNAGEKLEIETAKNLSNGSGRTESTARLYGELLTANSERLREIATLEAQMEGLTTSNLAQQPTLPEVSIKPKKGLIAITATLAAGFLMLLFIFARHALSNASKAPEQAVKVQRLRQALRLKAFTD